MYALKSLVSTFFCLLFFFLLLPISVFSYYSEEFNGATINTEVWQGFENSGTIQLSNGRLQLSRSSAPSKTSPYIFNSGNIFPETGAFSIAIKYRYSSAGNFGDAIAISPGLVPPNGINPDSNLPEFMVFMIYQDSPNGLSFGKILCDEDGSNCNNRTFIRPFTHYPDLNDHEVKIEYDSDGRYTIYFDGVDIPEFRSAINQKRPKKIWMGNSLITSSNDLWSSIEIDYIRITPKLNAKTPTIVLPGFGGSWDIQAILSGTQGTNWNIPPFVKEYDGIINSLRNAGYEDGKDLFVFPYDWRKKLNDLAFDLKSFISSNSLTDKKINLIGHSMGGLVARTYLQTYNNPNVEKVVTVGSPHKGIVDAYGLWEGGVVWDGAWWQKVLLEIASEVNRRKGEMKIEAIRRVSPSTKDLMPTENFLKQNGVFKAWSSLTFKNDFLAEKNLELTSFLPRIVAGGSNDYGNTKSVLNVENQSLEDKMLGLWTDGKPKQTNTFLFSTGDGFVPLDSSHGLFTNRLSLNGGHGETISKLENIVKILDEVGVATESAVESSTDNRKRAFVAKLNSPGKLFICLLNKCNEQLGVYFADEKLLIVPEYSNEKYTISIKSMGELGNYNLLVGEINETGEWVGLTGS